MGEWTIFSNHGHVLVCLANNNQARLRDVAAEVGITERAVQNILRELQGSGIVQVTKHGRCNHYQINTRKSLRHPLESHCTVGRLLQMLRTDAPGSAPTPATEEIATSSSPPATEAPSPKPARKAAKAAEPAKPEPANSEPAKPNPAEPDPVKPNPVKAAPAEAAGAETSADKTAGKAGDKAKSTKAEASKDKANAKKTDKPDSQQGSLF